MTAREDFEKHKAEFHRLTDEYNRQFRETGIADRDLGSASEQAWILMNEAARHFSTRPAFDWTTDAGRADYFTLNDVLTEFFQTRSINHTPHQIDQCVHAIADLYDFTVDTEIEVTA